MSCRGMAEQLLKHRVSAEEEAKNVQSLLMERRLWNAVKV